MKTIKDKLTYSFLKMIGRHFERLSHTKRILIANQFAAFVYNFIPIRRGEALKNIRRAFPDRSDLWITSILKSTYRLTCINFIELLSLPSAFKSLQFNVKNKSVIDDALAEKKGVIVITGHFGLWEIWSAWLGQNGYPLWGIIQRQGNKGADVYFREKRESYGLNQIYRSSSLHKVHKLLSSNKVIILASDQDAKQKGVFVKFFNKNASTHKGPAIFHLRTNAPMIFSVSHLEPDGSISISFDRLEVKNETSIDKITQAHTAMLESKVRKFPDHYFWFHRKWKTQLTA